MNQETQINFGKDTYLLATLGNWCIGKKQITISIQLMRLGFCTCQYIEQGNRLDKNQSIKY